MQNMALHVPDIFPARLEWLHCRLDFQQFALVHFYSRSIIFRTPQLFLKQREWLESLYSNEVLSGLPEGIHGSFEAPTYEEDTS